MISKHISIDEEYFDRIKPYIEKHNGNLGAAFREIINNIEIYNSNTNIDPYLSDWLFSQAEGRLIPDNIIEKMINPSLINSMKKLDEYLNNRLNRPEWDVNINLDADNDTLPSNILIDIRGSLSRIKIVAGILSKYLIRYSSERSPLGIKSVAIFNQNIRIEFSMMDKKKSIESLSKNFGYIDEILTVYNHKPSFWRTIIERHINSNYNMVTIHRNHFEELLANNIPMFGEIITEIYKKKVTREINLDELLILIKCIYENSRIVDKIDIDKHDMIIYHGYRNEIAIDNLKKILVTLLENSGHLYDAKITSNMIIMRYVPDIDVNMNQILTNLNVSDSNIDQELTRFLICLTGLKDITDTLSLPSIGRNIGKSLMQEYEKDGENNNGFNNNGFNNNGFNNNNGNTNKDNHWNIDKFKKVIEIIDHKFHRISEWKSENGNISYTVKKCNITKDDNKINHQLCLIIKEIFKGALEYAFGDNAKLETKKLMSHGDNFCEVIIRTK